MAFRKKLRILRDLISSNSEKSSEIIMDAFWYISALTLKLEALERERMIMNDIMNHADQLPLLKVNVERVDKIEIRLMITIENAKDNYLVNILEAFEDMGLIVVDARVSCAIHFAMETTVEIKHIANNVDCHEFDDSALSQAILRAIGKRSILKYCN